MDIKKHIPNFITLMNLLSGIISIYLGMTGEIKLAAAMIFLAAVFDFFDGFLARILNAKSEIGVQLDSLADMVSFGVAPAFVLYHTMQLNLDIQGGNPDSFLPFVAFIVPLFSALRLAKFNIDEEQTTSFKGLPTPATGILFASFPITILVCMADNQGLYYNILTNLWFLAGVAVGCSFLMVSNLPMFAMKFKSVGWAENQTRYIFIILSVFLLILMKMAAIPLIILMYILISVAVSLFNKKPTHSE